VTFRSSKGSCELALLASKVLCSIILSISILSFYSTSVFYFFYVTGENSIDIEKHEWSPQSVSFRAKAGKEAIKRCLEIACLRATRRKNSERRIIGYLIREIHTDVDLADPQILRYVEGMRREPLDPQ
jgi:hypothetical protein